MLQNHVKAIKSRSTCHLLVARIRLLPEALKIAVQLHYKETKDRSLNIPH